MNNLDIVEGAYTGRDFIFGGKVVNDKDVGQSIAGWTFYLALRKTPTAAATVVDISDNTHPDEVNGVFSVKIPRATTVNLAGRYYYELAAKDGNDEVHTVCTGVILFKPNLKGTIA